ncbi:MAG: DUF4396 domain-containing protein [Phenylobacterium sp.]
MSDHHHHDHAAHGHGESLNRTAVMATVHCLSGCAIGEVAGMVIGTGLNLSNATTVVLSVVLAFITGYGLTMRPLLKSGMALRAAAGLALASDTLSVATMEVVDNALMLVIPGAMAAQLTDALFWFSLAGSLVIAGVAAFPVNRWLIARGKGHALVHEHHHH